MNSTRRSSSQRDRLPLTVSFDGHPSDDYSSWMEIECGILGIQPRRQRGVLVDAEIRETNR